MPGYGNDLLVETLDCSSGMDEERHRCFRVLVQKKTEAFGVLIAGG